MKEISSVGDCPVSEWANTGVAEMLESAISLAAITTTAVLTTDVLTLLHAATLQSSFAIMINNIRLSERSICAQISKLLLTAIDEPVRKIMCIFTEEIGELVRLRTVLSAMPCHVDMYRQTMKKTRVDETLVGEDTFS